VRLRNTNQKSHLDVVGKSAREELGKTRAKEKIEWRFAGRTTVLVNVKLSHAIIAYISPTTPKSTKKILLAIQNIISVTGTGKGRRGIGEADWWIAALRLSLGFGSALICDRKKSGSGGRELDLLPHRARVEIMPVTGRQRETARSARRRYGRGGHLGGLDMGSCCSYVLAKCAGEPLLFNDDDFSRIDVKAAYWIT
jgi:uncharacterized protein with PIN domain